jgi:Zn-dependent metalloprotease
MPTIAELKDMINATRIYYPLSGKNKAQLEAILKEAQAKRKQMDEAPAAPAPAAPAAPAEAPKKKRLVVVRKPDAPAPSPVSFEVQLKKADDKIKEAEKEVLAQQTTVEERVAKGETYINNEGKEITLDVDLPLDESKKKTYMIKDESGQIQIKDR